MISPFVRVGKKLHLSDACEVSHEWLDFYQARKPCVRRTKKDEEMHEQDIHVTVDPSLMATVFCGGQSIH